MADYTIDQDHFYVWRVGDKKATGPALSEVPNAFVLLEILDQLFQRTKTG